MKFTKVLCVLLIGMVAVSCSDGDETPPVVNILTPTQGATIEAGDEFTLSGIVTDNEELVKIIVRNGGSELEIDRIDSPIRSAFNVTVTTNPDSEGILTVTVIGEDAEGNQGSSFVDVTVQ